MKALNQQAWFRRGLALSAAASEKISFVLLAAVFYVIIVPAGLILRISGRKDPLWRRLDRNAATYWQPHSSLGTMKDLF